MGANENLKSRRKEKGYTQQSMSKALGVSLGAYRNWEQGINFPDKENIIKLTKLLETTSDFILGQTNNPDPKNYNSNNYSGKKKYLMDRIAKADDKKIEKFQKMMELIDDEENGHNE